MKLVKWYIWSIALCVAENCTFWKVQERGAGEGWGRSVGPITWELSQGGEEYLTNIKKKEG